MDENICPVVARDKAEPFAVIEPFLSSPFLVSKRLVSKKKPQSQKSLWPPSNKNFQFPAESIAHPPPNGKGCEKLAHPHFFS